MRDACVEVGDPLAGWTLERVNGGSPLTTRGRLCSPEFPRVGIGMQNFDPAASKFCEAADRLSFLGQDVQCFSRQE